MVREFFFITKKSWGQFIGRRHHLWKGLMLGLMGGCFGPQVQLPGLNEQSHTNRSAENPLSEQAPIEGKQRVVETTNTAGTTSGTLKADSTQTQTIEPPLHSPLSGTTVSFPPGSLAVDTDIFIEEASPVASSVSAAEMGVQEFISPASRSVAVSSGHPENLTQPFVIALSVESSSSALKLTTDGQNTELVVFYRYQSISDGKIYQGIVTKENYRMIQDKVSFETRYFGIFQLAYVKGLPSILTPSVTTLPLLTLKKAEGLPKMNLLSRSPVVVSKGEVVRLNGINIRPSMVLAYSGKKITDATWTSDTQFTLKLPESSAFGLNTITAEQDGVSQNISLFYRADKSDYPIMTEVPEKVCDGTKFYNQTGQLLTGTKPCTAKICSESGETGCLIGAGFKAFSEAELIPGNIKRGVVLAGVTGNFPSTTSPLPRYVDSGATPDTAGSDMNDLTNFTSQLTSEGTFEYWDSSGMRRTGSGDGDLVAANIKNGVIFENFSMTGSSPTFTQCSATVKGVCLSDPACGWTGSSCELNTRNIRAGVTIAGKNGSLKTNCRNTVDSSFFNYDGVISGLTNNSPSPPGSNLDFWDSLQDWDGFPQTKVTAWSDDTRCDRTDWTDVTTTTGGSTWVSCGTSSTCIYKDELSGLLVSGLLGSDNWAGGIRTCHSSTYGGYPTGSWRLPTQKEMLTLYNHGIVDLVGPNFHTLPNFKNYYWTATTDSPTHEASAMEMARGSADSKSKTNSYKILCVRQ